MKKILMLLATIFVSFSFYSCSDDTEDPVKDVTVDLAKQVVGTYVGDGVLTYYGLEEEKYPGMKIVITRSSSDYVLLKLVHANNNTMLEELVYKVLQTSSKDYILSSDSNPFVKISISQNGDITYTNPDITVDGYEGFTISFNGKIDKNA